MGNTTDENLSESEEQHQRVDQVVGQLIFAVSAAMVGVCLTLMGLVAIITELDDLATLTEELLAANALTFLVACLSSYFSIRAREIKLQRRYERVADITFVIGMISVVVIGAIVALRLV